MAKLRPSAVKLLRRVRDHILADPRRYDQSTFIRTRSGSYRTYANTDWPACGTAACIAGWTVILGKGVDGNALYRMDVPGAAKRLLHLTVRQRLDLFHTTFGNKGHWSNLWCHAHSKDSKAKVAARRINYMIRTGR